MLHFSVSPLEEFHSQFYPLEVFAGHEVLQAAVSDQRAVIQLQGGEPLLGLAGAQLPDALISDQLAVRQREAEREDKMKTKKWKYCPYGQA